MISGSYIGVGVEVLILGSDASNHCCWERDGMVRPILGNQQLTFGSLTLVRGAMWKLLLLSGIGINIVQEIWI